MNLLCYIFNVLPVYTCLCQEDRTGDWTQRRHKVRNSISRRLEVTIKATWMSRLKDMCRHQQSVLSSQRDSTGGVLFLTLSSLSDPFFLILVDRTAYKTSLSSTVWRCSFCWGYRIGSASVTLHHLHFKVRPWQTWFDHPLIFIWSLIDSPMATHRAYNAS